jgi:hypothetical protein
MRNKQHFLLLKKLIFVNKIILLYYKMLNKGIIECVKSFIKNEFILNPIYYIFDIYFV